MGLNQSRQTDSYVLVGAWLTFSEPKTDTPKTYGRQWYIYIVRLAGFLWLQNDPWS